MVGLPASIGSGDVAGQYIGQRRGIGGSVGPGEEGSGLDALPSGHGAELEPDFFPSTPCAHHTSASGPLTKTAGLLRFLAIAVSTFTCMVHLSLSRTVIGPIKILLPILQERGQAQGGEMIPPNSRSWQDAKSGLAMPNLSCFIQ